MESVYNPEPETYLTFSKEGIDIIKNEAAQAERARIMDILEKYLSKADGYNEALSQIESNSLNRRPINSVRR